MNFNDVATFHGIVGGKKIYGYQQYDRMSVGDKLSPYLVPALDTKYGPNSSTNTNTGTSITGDSAGNHYTLDSTYIKKFNPDGTLAWSYSAPVSGYDIIKVDRGGTVLVVVNSSNGYVKRLSTTNSSASWTDNTSHAGTVSDVVVTSNWVIIVGGTKATKWTASGTLSSKTTALTHTALSVAVDTTTSGYTTDYIWFGYAGGFFCWKANLADASPLLWDNPFSGYNIVKIGFDGNDGSAYVLGDNTTTNTASQFRKCTPAGVEIWRKTLVSYDVTDLALDDKGNIYICGNGGGTSGGLRVEKFGSNGSSHFTADSTLNTLGTPQFIPIRIGVVDNKSYIYGGASSDNRRWSQEYVIQYNKA